MADAEKAKTAYHRYNYALLAYVLVLIIFAILAALVGNPPVLAVVSLVIKISLFIYALITVYELAKMLREHQMVKIHPLVWVFLMVIPFANLVTIFVLYRKGRAMIKTLANS